MNIKRTLLIGILLALIGVRHFILTDEKENTGIESLAPALSALLDIHLKTESRIKQLIDDEMKAPPDQDYLIRMVIDKLEMINLSCFYNHEMIETLVSDGLNSKYRPAYMEKLKNNMRFEIAWIQNNMERITSIHPMIKEEKVLNTIMESQELGQTLIGLFRDTAERIDKLIEADDGGS